MNKLLCSKREAAQALSCSIRSIENLVSMKMLQSKKLGRRRLIVCADLERVARQGVAVITGTKPQGGEGEDRS
jgi:hypothetical protein